MSKLENIVAFIAVVEANGFRAAAAQQRISTASISRQVNRLEMEMGAQLLHRTTRQLTLTEVGSQYYEQCKKTINELSEIEAAISQGQKEAVGTLHIMSTPHLCLKFYGQGFLIS